MNAIRSWISKGAQVGDLKKTSDWLKPFVDGNLFLALFEKGPTGKLVGEDQFGNKYYEDDNCGYDRKRWVIYADKTTYNPSIIPPEWHGWINYINDYPPTTYKYPQPIYQIPACVTKTGTALAYQPKGSWTNPEKRNWIKYEAWKPPTA